LLRTLGYAGPVTDPALIQFARAPEPCQKSGKVGGVKQRLLAELDAFEVTSFDRCVERSAADSDQRASVHRPFEVRCSVLDRQRASAAEVNAVCHYRVFLAPGTYRLLLIDLHFMRNANQFTLAILHPC